MFEKYMVCENGFRNVTEQGKVTGFQLQARIAYYRGMFLSMLEDYAVSVDGEVFPREAIKFSVGGHAFTLDELYEQTTIRWQFGDVATVTVAKPGGLVPGMHTLEVTQRLRVPYTDVRDVATSRRTITLVA
jgi:hypothetical protein